MHMKKLMLAMVALATTAGTSARAAGIAVDLQSARGVGMAGSMIGLVDDASGMYFNPAGIVQGQGLEVMIGAAPIVPFFRATPNGGAEQSGVTNLITPAHMYFTYGIRDDLDARPPGCLKNESSHVGSAKPLLARCFPFQDFALQ